MHLLSKFELKIPQSYPQTALCHSFITNWSQNTFSELRVNMPGLPAKLPDMEQIFFQLWEFRPSPLQSSTSFREEKAPLAVEKDLSMVYVYLKAYPLGAVLSQKAVIYQ